MKVNRFFWVPALITLVTLPFGNKAWAPDIQRNQSTKQPTAPRTPVAKPPVISPPRTLTSGAGVTGGFTLNREAGTVQFGDGDRGRKPSTRISGVREAYRQGGGVGGNSEEGGYKLKYEDKDFSSRAEKKSADLIVPTYGEPSKYGEQDNNQPDKKK